jgi:hypothetical protein
LDIETVIPLIVETEELLALLLQVIVISLSQPVVEIPDTVAFLRILSLHKRAGHTSREGGSPALRTEICLIECYEDVLEAFHPQRLFCHGQETIRALDTCICVELVNTESQLVFDQSLHIHRRSFLMSVTKERALIGP